MFPEAAAKICIAVALAGALACIAAYEFGTYYDSRLVLGLLYGGAVIFVGVFAGAACLCTWIYMNRYDPDSDDEDYY